MNFGKNVHKTYEKNVRFHVAALLTLSWLSAESSSTVTVIVSQQSEQQQVDLFCCFYSLKMYAQQNPNYYPRKSLLFAK